MWMVDGAPSEAVLQGSRDIPAVLSGQVSGRLHGKGAPSGAQPKGYWIPCTVTAEVSRGETEDVAAVSCSVTALCRLLSSQIWSGPVVLPPLWGAVIAPNS